MCNHCQDNNQAANIYRISVSLSLSCNVSQTCLFAYCLWWWSLKWGEHLTLTFEYAREPYMVRHCGVQVKRQKYVREWCCIIHHSPSLCASSNIIVFNRINLIRGNHHQWCAVHCFTRVCAVQAHKGRDCDRINTLECCATLVRNRHSTHTHTLTHWISIKAEGENWPSIMTSDQSLKLINLLLRNC